MHAGILKMNRLVQQLPLWQFLLRERARSLYSNVRGIEFVLCDQLARDAIS